MFVLLQHGIISSAHSRPERFPHDDAASVRCVSAAPNPRTDPPLPNHGPHGRGRRAPLSRFRRWMACAVEALRWRGVRAPLGPRAFLCAGPSKTSRGARLSCASSAASKCTGCCAAAACSSSSRRRASPRRRRWPPAGKRAATCCCCPAAPRWPPATRCCVQAISRSAERSSNNRTCARLKQIVSH